MSPAIDPGRFRRRLTVLVRLPSDDGLGGDAGLWTGQGAVWAMVEPVAAAQTATYGAIRAVIRHRVTLRFGAGIEPGMRLSDGARLFHVETVHDPDATGRYLQCAVAEIEGETP